MTTAEELRLVIEILGVIFMPAILWLLTRQDRDRRAHFAHLDACIDETRREIVALKNVIAGTGVTRADLERAQISSRAETAMERLERERSCQGLHDRIMRLENIQLQRKSPE